MTSKEFAVRCVVEFLKVALGPDPVRHGLDLTDVANAYRFRRTMDDLKKVADGP